MSRSAKCPLQHRSVRCSIPLLLFPLSLLLSLFLTDSSSASTWERYFTWDYNEEGNSIIQTSDSGFVIAGTTHSFGPGAPDLGNPCLMKLDSLGNLLWIQTYGSPLDEIGRSVAPAPDGGFIICGTRLSQDWSTSQYYVIKTDSEGRLEWEKTYGPADMQCSGLSIAPVRVGGYVMAGTVISYWYHQPGEFLIVRTNMSGDVMWEYKYSDPGYSNVAWAIQEAPDGGYIVGGYSWGDSYPDVRMILMRLTPQGRVKWTRHYDPNFEAVGYSASLTRDGGCILGGWTLPTGAYSADVCLVKTDADGNQQWKLIYHGDGSETLWSVRQTADGGYIGCGNTSSSGHGSSDLFLMRVDAAGRLVWTKTYGGPFSEVGYSVIQDFDGGYAMTGVESSWGPNSGIYVVKTDENGNVHAEKNAPAGIRLLPSQVTVAPNPFEAFATVPGKGRDRFSVYDVLGRRVGRYLGERIGSDLPPGVYMLRPNDGSASSVRIVKTR